MAIYLPETTQTSTESLTPREIVAELGRELLAPPAVAQCHGDSLLGVVLADDVVVQRSDDRLGCELVFQHVGLLPAALGE